MTFLDSFVQGVEGEQDRRDAAGAYNTTGPDFVKYLRDRHGYDLQSFVLVGLLRSRALDPTCKVQMRPVGSCLKKVR